MVSGAERKRGSEVRKVRNGGQCTRLCHNVAGERRRILTSMNVDALLPIIAMTMKRDGGMAVLMPAAVTYGDTSVSAKKHCLILSLTTTPVQTPRPQIFAPIRQVLPPHLAHSSWTRNIFIYFIIGILSRSASLRPEHGLYAQERTVRAEHTAKLLYVPLKAADLVSDLMA